MAASVRFYCKGLLWILKLFELNLIILLCFLSQNCEKGAPVYCHVSFKWNRVENPTGTLFFVLAAIQVFWQVNPCLLTEPTVGVLACFVMISFLSFAVKVSWRNRITQKLTWRLVSGDPGSWRLRWGVNGTGYSSRSKRNTWASVWTILTRIPRLWTALWTTTILWSRLVLWKISRFQIQWQIPRGEIDDFELRPLIISRVVYLPMSDLKITPKLVVF